MQHPVMRAAETDLVQDPIGIADEVAIGEEQRLDEPIEIVLLHGRRRGGDRFGGAFTAALVCGPAARVGNYVSHVDIFVLVSPPEQD